MQRRIEKRDIYVIVIEKWEATMCPMLSIATLNKTDLTSMDVAQNPAWTNTASAHAAINQICQGLNVLSSKSHGTTSPHHSDRSIND